MIGAKQYAQYAPDDLRASTIENLFWKQIKHISRPTKFLISEELKQLEKNLCVQFSDDYY